MIDKYSIPIGMDKMLEKIIAPDEETDFNCEPANLIIPLDSGEGRHTLLRYLSYHFRVSGSVDYSSGLDDFIYLECDGSLDGVHELFYEIEDAAIFKNYYSGIIAIDISDIANHPQETQYSIFLNQIKKAEKKSMIIFFTKTNISKNEERLIQKLSEIIPNVQVLSSVYYTKDDLCNVIISRIKSRNIEIDDCNIYDEISELIDKHNISYISETTPIVAKLEKRAKKIRNKRVIKKTEQKNNKGGY